MTSLFFESLVRFSRLNLLTGSQLPSQRAWLSSTDPSINHNILRKARNEGTAVWFFQGKIFIEWKSTGCLLWIHGKRTRLTHLSVECLLTPVSLAGSGKSVLWFAYPSLLLVGTYSSPVPLLFKTLRFCAKLDPPSWHTFTSIPRISTNKPVTISCAVSYLSSPFALALVLTFSTIYTRCMTMGLDSQLTTL